MPDEGQGLGDVKPRKRAGWTTYAIIGVLCVLVIGGVTLFTGGDDKANGSPSSVSPSTPVTIPQLQEQIATTNGRIDTLKSTVDGWVASDVTQADINDLQTNINSLSADIDALGNSTSSINVSGGSTYWLTGDDDDIRLHILSAKDMRFVAEVTVSYDDSISFSNATYDMALSDFYDDVGNDRDYIPNLIPDNITTITVTTCADYNLTILQGGINTTFVIPFCYNTTTTLSDWEYSTVTFHTDSFKVTANVEKSGWIDGLKELGDYDTISVRLLPSLEASETGDGDWF